MPLQLVTAPTQEPVSLAEARLHLRVDFSDDDALIMALIRSARLAAETITGRQLVTARWKYILDSFPGPSLMGVPAGQPFTPRARGLESGQDDHVPVITRVLRQMVQHPSARGHAAGGQNDHWPMPGGQ